MLEMALVENIQRKNLDPIEVALSYQRLIDEIQLTQEELSTRVGKKTFYCSKLLKVIKIRPYFTNRNERRFYFYGAWKSND